MRSTRWQYKRFIRRVVLAGLLFGTLTMLLKAQQVYAQQVVTITGRISPPQWGNIVYHGNWDVKVEVQFDNPDKGGLRETFQSWNVSADNNGVFYFNGPVYTDLLRSAYVITVLGGSGYHSDTGAVLANRPGHHSLSFSMRPR